MKKKELEIGPVSVHGHINYPGQWVWDCRRLGIFTRPIPIEIGDDFDAIQKHVIQEIAFEVEQAQKVLRDVQNYNQKTAMK